MKHLALALLALTTTYANAQTTTTPVWKYTGDVELSQSWFSQPPYNLVPAISFSGGVGRIEKIRYASDDDNYHIFVGRPNNAARFTCSSTPMNPAVTKRSHYIQLDGKWYSGSGDNAFTYSGSVIDGAVNNCVRPGNAPVTRYTAPFVQFSQFGQILDYGQYSLNPTVFVRYTHTYQYVTLTSRDGDLVCAGEIPAPPNHTQHPNAELQISLDTGQVKCTAGSLDYPGPSAN